MITSLHRGAADGLTLQQAFKMNQNERYLVYAVLVLHLAPHGSLLLLHLKKRLFRDSSLLVKRTPASRGFCAL